MKCLRLNKFTFRKLNTMETVSRRKVWAESPAFFFLLFFFLRSPRTCWLIILARSAPSTRKADWRKLRNFWFRVNCGSCMVNSSFHVGEFWFYTLNLDLYNLFKDWVCWIWAKRWVFWADLDLFSWPAYRGQHSCLCLRSACSRAPCPFYCAEHLFE